MIALPPEPLFLPFEPPPFRMAMGLTACSPAQLILIDDRYPAQVAERRALLAQHGREVADRLPGTDDGVAELVARIQRVRPDVFTVEGDALYNRLTGERFDRRGDNLAIAAVLVQEDLCLLEMRGGVPVLVAGTLVFSPGWRLSEKLGQPLASIHAGVPFYPERLARPVDRLMRHLRAGTVVERFNWGMHHSARLFRPPRGRPDPAITADDVLDRVFVRVERQTLSVMEASRLILFTIRSYVYSVRRVIAAPGGRDRLTAAVSALPSDMVNYKSIQDFRAVLLHALTSRGVRAGM